jgi:hypothetical protein
MRLAERAGRKLEHWSNSVPRGMVVITGNRRNRIRPIGLLYYFYEWRGAAMYHAIFTLFLHKSDDMACFVTRSNIK